MILHLPPSSPLWEQAAADIALVLHIGGGLVGIASGSAALVLRKGGAAHRLAGNLFFGSMLIMASVGAAVSPLIGQPANVVGGVFALYFLVTGWMAAKRKDGPLGVVELGAMAIPIAVAAAMLAFGFIALASPSHEIEGVPAPAPFVMAALAALAAGADIRVVLRRRLEGASRIARHLWRLCAALLIADGSLFLGQPKVFPPTLRGSPVMFLPELFVFVIMITWLVRLRRRSPARPGAAALAGAFG
ncbi:MAG TPA: hypothetical protein VII63_10855 [Caulobacteraceae bacterium]